ncbi:PAS domain S-box-containing protein/diguanylate cyclase (GGDEF) domain-containing protein [Desulfuromusa kysingii]|uniref:diguanylate cyclase n=1 Tax=Desulfuromusa kysingii TaxID=37625 RepID=A0A1H3XAV5_9BACT|nr:diguanylate cyclase [Desulfuromusa kysingii]SDZ96526.1 PAS domain S-box-containing protein/diguanylate cyclase (GGDEF) domain-containing protein [Desulfuromusa kysingii]
MAESKKQLENKILQLEKENQRLLQLNDEMKQIQTSYEQILGENNTRQLRSDIACMQLEQIFSAYSDPMWVLREDGRIIRVNDAMLAMLDKTDDEVLGKTCSSFLSHNLCQDATCPLKSRSTAKTTEVKLCLSGQVAEDSCYLLTTAPLIMIDGSPGIVAQFKDITSRKQVQEALEKMVHIDGLTQIANRRCFDDTLAKEWLRLKRSGQPVSLLLCDIDYFKKFNDHYGHQAGDDCLRDVAAALAGSVLRPADLAARYGGEEFVLLLPEVALEGAMKVAERVLEAVSALQIPHRNSEVGSTVSISIGAATLIPIDKYQPETLISLADGALYRAKEQGRNRFCLAPS